ncbi:MAG: DUF4268 domain-containing protein [Desulfuromonadales bacterium]|nr:DUF4268 domain-containing protein [Desulfuromonadales bacterium]
MSNFGELKKVPLREIWSHEAIDFTPWLASNVEALGDALGLELELTEREASVGDFSLDLLAKDLGSSRTVIIENQLTQTDHDHLGKLLTYAAGFNASTVIWVSEIVRDEHRQALEWLNQRTDTETQFFAVVVEVLKIDDSKPAFNFKPVVFPNEWQKSKKQKTSTNTSSRSEKYRAYFQALIDELRDEHRFTGARAGQPQNWYSFSSGIQGILYSAAFSQGGKVRAERYIDQGDQEKNKSLFDALRQRKDEITASFGGKLEWERLDEKRASRIAVYRDGNIEISDSELEEIRRWHIENLLKIKKIFTPEVQQLLN